MTVIGIIVGGWLAFNVLFVVALLFRRDRPEKREELLHWVISGARRKGRLKPAGAGR
jgi:hypothetical protein